MFLKKSLFIVAALTLSIANYAYAGSNAAAVVSMDYVGSGAAAAGNGTDDKVVTGVVSGAAGTQFKVEIFAAGLASALTGSEARFKIDKTLIKVVNPTGGVTAPSTFPLILPNTDTTATVGAFSVGTPPNGHLMTVTFETVSDVTGKEFAIEVYYVQVAASPSDFDNLTGAKLAFNAVPKVTTDKTIATIPRGGQATATVIASGFPVGATVTYSHTTTGSATVTGATNSSGAYVLTVSGTGAATVSVTATDGTTTTTAAVVRFDEQVPVELAAFGGELVESQVVLNWTTASQTNNAGFRVLRSTDQETFEVVSDVIAGAGTTDALMNYSFNDGSLPAAEQVFYVLEQIDLDGTIHRSNPIEVILGARFVLPTEFASAVFPNPFNPSTTISYDLPAEAQVSIVIYDAIGQEVRQLVDKSHAAGRYSIQWDAKDQIGRNVGSGVYIAKVKAGTFNSTQKMLLLK